jgi:hypothetical protein
MKTYHTCILGYYGEEIPMGILPGWDGKLFTHEAAQQTVDLLEAERATHPEMHVTTPFGICVPVRAYLDSCSILWELAEREEGEGQQ